MKPAKGQFLKMFGDPATNPMGWPELPFADVFEDITSKCPKLQKKHYIPQGRFPVIDQGKGLVAGYTNDESLCTRSTEALVVFGDHTRVVKLIDFPFVAGADGSRVFRARRAVNPAFASVQLQLQPIPNLGYSRHMRAVRRLRFLVPDATLQNRFSDACDRLRASSDARGRSAKRVEDVFGSLLGRAFSGSLTASWREAHMKELLQEMEQQAKALRGACV